MTRFGLAVRQLLPALPAVLAYWLVAGCLIAGIAAGLEPQGERAGTLWGLELRFPGHSSTEILCSAYREMLWHVWTLAALPAACFVFLRPLARSFRNDFEEFLRYSRSPRILVESARIAALLLAAFGLALPFAGGLLWGVLGLGLDGPAVLDGLGWSAGCLLCVGGLIYFLNSLRVPTEIAAALGFASLFILSGFWIFLDRGDHHALRDLLPSGLPYTVEVVTSPNLRSGLALSIGFLALRLILASRTRWLLADPHELVPERQSTDRRRR